MSKIADSQTTTPVCTPEQEILALYLHPYVAGDLKMLPIFCATRIMKLVEDYRMKSLTSEDMYVAKIMITAHNGVRSE